MGIKFVFKDKRIKMKLRYLVFVFLLTGFLSSCEREFSVETGNDPANNVNVWDNTTPNATTHPARLFLSDRAANTVVLNTDNDSTHFLNFGTMLVTIPSRCFAKLNGTVVNGAITIRLKKATTFSEMVYNGLSTATSNQLLSTAGMVNVQATQGTEILKVANGKTIDVLFEKPIIQNFVSFTGVQNTTAANNITWQQNSMLTDTLSSPTGLGFTKIKIDSCVWVNCDYFYNLPNPTNLFLKLPVGYGNTNTLCYAVFRTDKIMVGLYPDVSNQQFWQGTNYKVPIGKQARLIAISRKNAKTYFGFVDLVIANNSSINISTMDEVSDADLMIKLNAL
jgi:hypothetical protein